MDDLSFLEKYGISYMEKNGLVQLTEDDLSLYNQGIISKRLEENWGIKSLSELREIIEAGQYELLSL